ncbi:MAG: DUF11 domain-containing protein, partial [FCB group bacterium]|nr:DUF11 domain-containing protein [FCB group bacterium]
PGEEVTYTISVTNLGPSAVTGATVADAFSEQLTGVTWSCAGSGGGTCTASGAGDINDDVDLPVGGSVTYTATGTVVAGDWSVLENTATVTAPAGVDDPDEGDNSATDRDSLPPQPIFSDGFESGSTSAWSSTVGGAIRMAWVNPLRELALRFELDRGAQRALSTCPAPIVIGFSPEGDPVLSVEICQESEAIS